MYRIFSVLRNKQSKAVEAAPEIPLKRSISERDIRNEHYKIIWLDQNVNDNKSDSMRTKMLLKNINNDQCSFFDDKDKFITAIQSASNQQLKTLLIVSGQYAKDILSQSVSSSLQRINEKLPSVIIFCQDYNKYKSLADSNRWFNVTDVCTDHETLKQSILRVLPSLQFNLFPAQKLMSTRMLSSFQNTIDDNSYFSYPLFVDLLSEKRSKKKIKDYETEKQIMLNKCRDFYRGNEPELQRIEKFRQTYTPSKAIEWYTEDSFVYRLINRAFRTEDMSLWYLFRFYCIDLSNELKNLQEQQNIAENFLVYRGQTHLPTDELIKIRNNIGQLISTNGFLSTSELAEVALMFVTDAQNTEEFKVVLFEIEVHPSSRNNCVFAKVHQYSEHDECEVLFDIGSTFEIISVTIDENASSFNKENPLTRIRMKTTNEKINELNKYFDPSEFRNTNIEIYFGRLLISLNQYEKAESYFLMLSHILSKTHDDIASIHDHLGYLHLQTTNWSAAYDYLNSAQNIKQKSLPTIHPFFEVTFNGLANYYKAMHNYTKALLYYKKALKCHRIHRFSISMAKLNQASIHILMENYDTALNLCQQAFQILNETQLSYELGILQYKGIMGDYYFARRVYPEAIQYYTEAFNLSENLLLIGDLRRLYSVLALIECYRAQGNIYEAKLVCEEQMKIYATNLTRDYSSIAYFKMKQAELYADGEEHNGLQLQLYEEALNILQRNTHLHHEKTVQCLTRIAVHHMKNHTEYESALDRLKSALYIQEKIYPRSHSIVKNTEKLIYQCKRAIFPLKTNNKNLSI
ncbi:unnamed protein product [Adineta steineri]|uniref:Tetratricopeptide repeat protein n=1 Tax=Adineta steineri TaxID=433720 RepID=A0A819JIY2_9BILA|nr:unnamed protein product [Adineta steineri]CAF3933613.1 unnamed protein product [Adineta steineri]